MDSSQDKDLPATDRRLQQARDDGQVARSKDLTNLVVLGGGFWLVVNFFPEALSRLIDGLRNQLRFDHSSLLKADLMSTHVVNALIIQPDDLPAACVGCCWHGSGSDGRHRGVDNQYQTTRAGLEQARPVSGVWSHFFKRPVCRGDEAHGAHRRDRFHRLGVLGCPFG
jgi:hypothetical protein